MKDRGTRLDGGAGSEQHGPQRVRLGARDGREGQLRLRAAAGRGLHLDLDEAEQAVHEGRRDVDAADAIERDRAHVPAEDARAQLQPPSDDEIAEPQPGQHGERNAEQERGEEQRDEDLRPEGDQQRDERDQARADEAPRDREQRQRVEPALEHRPVARLHGSGPLVELRTTRELVDQLRRDRDGQARNVVPPDAEAVVTWIATSPKSRCSGPARVSTV